MPQLPYCSQSLDRIDLSSKQSPKKSQDFAPTASFALLAPIELQAFPAARCRHSVQKQFHLHKKSLLTKTFQTRK